MLACSALVLLGCSSVSSSQNNTQLAEIDTQLAVLDLQQHQPESVKSHLLDAAALAPDDALVLAGEGFYDLQIYQDAEAARFYQQALAAAPRNPEIQNDYGVFLYQTHDYAAALPYFVKAAHNQQNLYAGEAWQNAGLTELKLGNPSAAQVDFTQAHLQE